MYLMQYIFQYTVIRFFTPHFFIFRNTNIMRILTCFIFVVNRITYFILWFWNGIATRILFQTCSSNVYFKQGNSTFTSARSCASFTLRREMHVPLERHMKWSAYKRDKVGRFLPLYSLLSDALLSSKLGNELNLVWLASNKL